MTPLAPHITAFLRERLPVDRRASEHTCDTYAHAFRLLFCEVSASVRDLRRLKLVASASWNC
jgi:integrase/recombinase XerD